MSIDIFASILLFGLLCILAGVLFWLGGLLYINYWGRLVSWLFIKPIKDAKKLNLSRLNLSPSNIYWQPNIVTPEWTEQEKKAYVRMFVNTMPNQRITRDVVAGVSASFLAE